MENPSAGTLDAIDKGLGWTPGSARALLQAGVPPTPVPVVKASVAPERRVEARVTRRRAAIESGAAYVPASAINQLTAGVRRLEHQLARLEMQLRQAVPDEDVSALREAVAGVSVPANRILRGWLIAAVEASVDEDREIPPLLQMLVSTVGETVSPYDETENLRDPELDDLAYYSWLARRVSDDEFTDAQRQAFRERLARAHDRML